MKMAGYRYGDANLNGSDSYDQGNTQTYDTARRLTRQYGQATNSAQKPQQAVDFKEFTRDSLAKIQKRKQSKSKRFSISNNDSSRQKLEPDPYLAAGVQLPQYILRQVPPKLIGKPIEDIDPYYADKETFVIISRGKELIRFNANKALWLFGPFHPIRRIVLCILVSSIFNLFVILTILVNCFVMTIQGSEAVEKTIEDTEIIFTIIYTFEFVLKVMARGFIFGEFTYLHDPWNILDITVITLSYLTIVIQDLGNLSVMRTFRVLRALKTVAIIPGMKTIVGAVIDSVKNLKDVVVLTLFSLSVFSLLGLQIYMGLLTQKCVLNGFREMNDSEWYDWSSNSSNWLTDPDSQTRSYKLCGNATGAQPCPPNYTCLQGFGPNPDFGFTNFDTFGWSLICSFRLMTQDYWEGLYMQVLKTAGSWHIIFFILSIFLGSIYLMNLILAIVAMSYNELQRRAEEEEEANLEDEAAFFESCRLMEMQERGSDYSARGSLLGTTYRPSLEIGLVGQTFLASFCQNGLLDENAREKLDRQIMSSQALPSAAPLRSRSLCINMERRRRRSSNQLMQYGLLVPVHSNSPQIMATSLNELSRRKSSTKTNSSAGSIVGQRRLLRDVSMSGQRLDIGDRLKRRQKLSHHASSNVLMPSSSNNNDNNGLSQPARARSSVTSDKDLKILKQKAAAIRIVSDDYSGNVLENENFRLQDQNTQAPNLLAISRQESPLTGRSASVQIERIRRKRTGSSMSNAAPLDATSELSAGSFRFRSEVAICEQPSVAHPLGRMVATQNLSHLSSTSLQPVSSRYRRRSSQRKPPPTSPRHGSTSSNTDHSLIDTPGQSTGRQLRHLPGGSTQPYTDITPLRQLSIVSINAPQNASSLSQTGNRSCSLKTLRLSSNRLNVNDFGRGEDQDRMRHLSVENFQQFGAMRPSPQRPNSPHSRQIHDLRNGSVVETLHNASEQSILREMDASAYPRSLMGRHSLRPRDSLEGSRVSNQPRPSIARTRHSILPSGYMAPTLDQQRYLQNYQRRQSFIPPPQSQIRRLSRDFVRQADGWSRLSMGGNVDLRRLLRLWSQSNPYQNRPSIGSCSLYSQASQMSRYNNNESPARHPEALNDPTKQAPFAPKPRYSRQLYSVQDSPPGSQTLQAYEVLSAVNARNNRYQSDARAFGTALPLDDNLAFDQSSISTRDKCIAYCLSCLDILCIWECCEGWLRIQRVIALIVFDPFTELFILLCILINTLFMALDNDDVDEQMRRLFEQGNYFFTATFVVEAVMKIIALSPKFYFREGFNVFDAIIVGLSLLELGLEGVYGLSVLRTFRLLRVFRLARSWPTMNVLISICGHAISDLGNLTFVLGIIVFIFAVMGMQLFGNKYTPQSFADGVVPRWNFKDFMHSFMIVFRILCAEWIEPLWDCMNAAPKEICIPFFITAVIIGNLVLLNLFLALLLASFGSSNLSGPQADHVDTRKLQEAIARFKRFGKFTKRVSSRLASRLASWLLCRKYTKNEGIGSHSKQDKRIKSHIATMSRQERQQNIERRTEELKSKIRRSPDHHYHLKQLAKNQASHTHSSYLA